MADIRINSLPSTATSFNTDDYIAIDGASGGTRKMLAANPPFSDVTLGSSGPSVKSTLSARAPRQGLVFDGTAAATCSVSALGSTDFTVGGWVYQASAATAGLISGASGSIAFYLLSNGTLRADRLGTGSTTASTGTVTAGKFSQVLYVRSGTTGTYYINGVAAGTTSDSFNYSTAISIIGGDSASSNILNGYFFPIVENRALSASEVVALYEAGAPAGADYNSAGQTLPITGYNLSGVTNLGGGVYQFNAAGNIFSTTSVVKKGKQYTAVFNVDAISGATIVIWNGTGFTNTGITTTGLKSFTYTAQSDSTFGMLANGGTMTISAIAPYGLGLLLAPDAAQAGGGLVWYDTSGNAANITLPASGVSWNVPTSGYVTSGSSLNLSAGGTNQNITLTPSGTGVINSAFGSNLKLRTSLGTTNVGTARIGAWYSGYVSNADFAAIEMAAAGASGGDIRFFTIQSGSTLSQKAMLAENGNFLIGTNVDSSALLQVGTNTTTAAGGMKFGTDVSLFRSAAGVLRLASTSNYSHEIVNTAGTGAATTSYSNTGGYLFVGIDSSSGGALGGGAYAGVISRDGAYSLILRTNSTTALTLDSSQNATFAGSYVRVSNSGASASPAFQLANGSYGFGHRMVNSTDLQFFRDINSPTAWLTVTGTTGSATFAGSIAIGNAVQTAVGVASTHKVTISIGGSTYYLLATNV